MLRRPVAAGYTSQIDVWFATNILTFGSRMPEARAPRLCHAGVAGIDIRNRSLRGFCPHWGRALVDWRDGDPRQLALFLFRRRVPVNFRLCRDPCGQGTSVVRELMRDWGLLKWGQTVIGFVTGCILAWALVLPA
jgi:hypothetical protein